MGNCYTVHSPLALPITFWGGLREALLMDSLKQIWGTVKQLFYCFDLLDHSSTEYVLCTVCVHPLHRCRWMTYRYGFVLYSDIDLYSLWGIGRNVVILQKGFAVHQLWHFDLFCTKHFEIQMKGFVWVRKQDCMPSSRRYQVALYM